MKKTHAQKERPIMDQPQEEKSPTQRLREANLKVTRPRLLILSLLRELKGHHSADELAELLQERHTPLSRASIYNSLDALSLSPPFAHFGRLFPHFVEAFPVVF